MAEIKIELPAIIKIQNTSTNAISFVPYRENFVSVLAAGMTLEFPATTAGQVLYYLNQATDGLIISQIDAFDAADNIIVLKTPATMTITNTSTVEKRFQPYKENFTIGVQPGDSYAIDVTTVGQILYYNAQATDGLTVTYVVKVQEEEDD